MWFLIFVLVVLTLSAAAFWLYRMTVRHYERKVIAEYEAWRQEQQRPHQAAHHETEVMIPAEFVENFVEECDNVLAQLEQRRREWRRAERLASR